ncbi:TRAP transporter large permease subunit [Alkalihalobacillus deserti]|uniref:TRAP transporter large permease subunit n=1 Tax=Alkalihalobacillus deserti TaxID=2879466 RepID=UPI0027E1D0EA|nr:TRAP transporter large permease subunit [Alkalihalobacillus deserti]
MVNHELASALKEKVELDPQKKNNSIKIIISAIPGILMPVIILGGIYGGVFTPTEAGTVAGVVAIFIGIAIYRELGRLRSTAGSLSSSL